MEIKEAIEVLKHHNVWRKGDDENAIMTNPKRLGIAIDTVISEFENLFISGVSGSLLEIDLIDWDHTCGDGCCYTYGQDITLNGEKLDEQNAEDSKNALTAVLTKLGYNVDINYR